MSWLEFTDWAKTLAAIGLEPLPGAGPFVIRTGASMPGTHVVGRLDGKRVDVILRSTTEIRVALEPALDLGLSIRPEGVLPRETRRTGHERFDALYSVEADEPTRVRAILTPDLLDVLLALLQQSTWVLVTDDRVAVMGQGEGWLRMAMPLAVEVAHRIDDRRRALVVPLPLAGHRAKLARLASDRLLRIDDAPIRLAGTANGVRVSAIVQREGPLRFALEARLQLDDALNIDLHVSPASLLTPLRALLPGQADHLVGDPELDAAFHVRTTLPDVLARALDAPARRALHACAAGARSFLLDDAGISLVLPLDPETAGAPASSLRAGLELLERLARGIRAVPPSPAAGPFR